MARRLALLALALGLLLPWPAVGYAEGVLNLTIVVIADDLTVKPVPAARFSVTAEPGGDGRPVVTDLQGHASLPLPAGHYRITSEKPVTYLTKTMTWNKVFDIQEGGTVELQLTSSDAEVSASGPSRQVDDAGLLYKQLKGGVVAIETDRGQGSGFIVGPNRHPDLEVVRRFVEFVLTRLDPVFRESMEFIMADEQPGWRQDTGKVGVLFPPYIGEFVLFDDEELR